jgi:hypothetical protein
MNQILELILQMDKSTGLVRIAYKTFEKCDAEATDGHTIVTANLEDFPKNAAGNAAFGRIIRWWLEGGLEGTAPSRHWLISKNGMKHAKLLRCTQLGATLMHKMHWQEFT